MDKHVRRPPAELIIITGLSGSGKGSVLRALEDAGYYSVDNLPIELIPKFAELTKDSPTVRAAALVVDIREGAGLKRFPALYAEIRRGIGTRLLFLEADDATLVRRFSETRRPHPLGAGRSVQQAVASERRKLAPDSHWRISSSTLRDSMSTTFAKRFWRSSVLEREELKDCRPHHQLRISPRNPNG